MSQTGKDILIRFKKRWQMMLSAESLLYGLGPAILVFVLFQSLFVAVSVFIIITVIAFIILQPWKINLPHVSSYIDDHINSVEYSSSLLIAHETVLSPFAQLQRHRVSQQLPAKIKQLQPDHSLGRAAIVAGIFLIFSLLCYQFGISVSFDPDNNHIEKSEKVVFKAVDSTKSKVNPPILESQKVTISYPVYTKKPAFSTSKMDVKALDGSRLYWQINFDAEVDSVFYENGGKSYSMQLKEEAYRYSSVLNSSGFYNFRFTDLHGKSYVSELYSIEVLQDQEPIIEIADLEQYTAFNYDEPKHFSFTTQISDDFGIADASIIATVSKGTGESVKFREEKLTFDNQVKSGSKNLLLSKKIDLNDLKMEPGDELYFYVQATDFKQPQPNISRSETFFAVIRDTVTYDEGVEGTLGVDLMPVYFRSQRQIIIDTEKLIKDKSKIAVDEFNSRSNDLGFDQKALRLKYGQFTGDENEGGTAEEEVHHDEETVETDDPLAGYKHNHDGSNENNLVEKSEEPEGDVPKFTQSIQSKLRQALNEMWDAELHLRMYDPQKSLPYQYRALDLLEQIKNSARIYVHRIGFDPPPIKEDKRLTGTLDEVVSFRKSDENDEQDNFQFMRKSILRIEQILNSDKQVTKADQELFAKAGTELSTLAIENPGEYLTTLQNLKWLAELEKTTLKTLKIVQKGLIIALPKESAEPVKTSAKYDELDQLMLKELQQND